jgi:hypothetical protein
MTKEITLTQGFVALVDDEDYAALSKLRWAALYAMGKRYAYRGKKKGGKNNAVLMHRVITGAVKGQVVDHANGDTLDNRRANLRVCTQSENLGNQMLRKNSSSGFKGVHWNKRNRAWASTAAKIRLGYFKTAEDAALAYDSFARARWGQFARLNFPGPGEVSCRPGVFFDPNTPERYTRPTGIVLAHPGFVSRQVHSWNVA